ncbi:hypothetical protein MKZ38_010206 [Zalerion maritima]|uniref:Uncharacterized protein n=1 Tax=Zalerion maritima TaxID=339359 RepID=A0AAD5RTH4_9PEZI|nr:hypothetical protein MKZ38_010206 [Zalerion maritima]
MMSRSHISRAHFAPCPECGKRITAMSRHFSAELFEKTKEQHQDHKKTGECTEPPTGPPKRGMTREQWDAWSAECLELKGNKTPEKHGNRGEEKRVRSGKEKVDSEVAKDDKPPNVVNVREVEGDDLSDEIGEALQQVEGERMLQDQSLRMEQDDDEVESIPSEES